MGIFNILVSTIWFLIPAYIANSVPVASTSFFDTKTPIDSGLSLNGSRILGDGKTWEGTFSGIAAGLFAGFVLLFMQTSFQLNFLPFFSFELIILLVSGALIGDMVASFFKRRFEIESGKPVLFLDQLDFYFGSIAFALPVYFSLPVFMIGLVITPPLHKLFNVLAKKIAIKEVAW